MMTYPRLRPWLIAACLVGAVLVIVFTDGCAPARSRGEAMTPPERTDRQKLGHQG